MGRLILKAKLIKEYECFETYFETNKKIANIFDEKDPKTYLWTPTLFYCYNQYYHSVVSAVQMPFQLNLITDPTATIDPPSTGFSLDYTQVWQLYCNVMFSTVQYITVLYRTVLFCTVLFCTVLYCAALHCTVLRCTVLYCTLLYCTVLYCTVLYCTLLYCTVLIENQIFWSKIKGNSE